MPGMGRSPAWWRKYEALRRAGHSKESAARIANTPSKRRKARRNRKG